MVAVTAQASSGELRMPAKYVPVAGVATHFLYGGPTTLPPLPPRYDHGPAVLFLHGAGGNAGLWRRQMEHFGGTHAAVAVDLPAHGRSGGTEGLGSIGACADFALAFTAAIEMPPAVVVGVCMGGAVAIEMALAAPGRVRALVLACTSARLRFATATVETWREVAQGRLPQPFTPEAFSPATDFAIMRELWMEQVKTDPRVRWTDMLACNDFDAASRLAGIGVPVLVVAGRDSRIVPLEAAESLAAAIPGAALRVLDQAGHFAPAERAGEFNAAVGDFLAGLEGERR